MCISGREKEKDGSLKAFQLWVMARATVIEKSDR